MRNELAFDPESILDHSLLPRTRVHLLRRANSDTVPIYIKREDETGFATTGGKLRKYASILPYLAARQIEVVAVVGSANSNHVVAACQLLIEAGICPVPILKRTHTRGTNQFLLELLLPRNEWIELDGHAWNNLDMYLDQFKQLQSGLGKKAWIIPEGAFCAQALGGAMTLAEDIARNELEMGLQFSDIFIDAGTGLNAMALMLGLHRLRHSALLHVVLMADNVDVFWEKWAMVVEWYEQDFEEKLPDLRDRFCLHLPLTAQAFGSVNAEVLSHVRRYAREAGIFTDPIYSAKLLATAERIVDGLMPKGDVLVIHSGGGQSLSGFEDKLKGA